MIGNLNNQIMSWKIDQGTLFSLGERRKEKEIKYKRKPAYEESSNVDFLVIGVRKRMEKLRL